MLHQKARIFLFIFLLMFFSSCATPRILGLYRNEATELLRKGDLSFIIYADLPQDFSESVSRLTELIRIHPAAPFYAGLLVGAQAEAGQSRRRWEALLFSAALESPSSPARREAGHRLIRLILESAEEQEILDILGFLTERNMNARADTALLRAACLYRLGRFEEAARLLPPDSGDESGHGFPEGWGRALSFFSAWNADAEEAGESKRQEITAFLFGLPAGDLRRWAYSEALSIEGLLDPGERGIIFSRRFPVSHNITLNNLQPALSDGGLLFFRHPRLIEDIARAFQFTPARREEGIHLFTSWDNLLETRAGGGFGELEDFVRTLDSEEVNTRRYLILHFAGRIERARNNLAASTENFRRALAFAPDTRQSDACYWYILMNTLVHDPAGAADAVLNTMPGWDDMSVFNGVLDRLSRNLTANRQWDILLEVFNALENISQTGRAGTSLAQYAWIAGRAVQEGFLITDRSAESFFRVAFEQPAGSFYYRTMAAVELGERFSPTGNQRRRRAASVPVAEGSELEFLLGFFEYGAASFVLPFVRSVEDSLPVPELRLVAQAMGRAQQRAESIRLVARYMRRPGFQPGREDFYLFHPRPYLEQVERHAEKTGIRPEMLFGLIRTESHFEASVVSHAGAVGLAQLMPATAQDIAGRIARAGGPDFRTSGGIDLTDPETNIHLGSFYLRHLIQNQMEGSPMLALKAYNGGQGRVRRWLAEDRAREDGGLPKDLFLETLLYPETRQYGRLVLGAAALYGYLYYGKTMEEVALSFFR